MTKVYPYSPRERPTEELDHASTYHSCRGRERKRCGLPRGHQCCGHAAALATGHGWVGDRRRTFPRGDRYARVRDLPCAWWRARRTGRGLASSRTGTTRPPSYARESLTSARGRPPSCRCQAALRVSDERASSKSFGDRTTFSELRDSSEELQQLVEDATKSGSLHPHAADTASRALEFQEPGLGRHGSAPGGGDARAACDPRGDQERARRKTAHAAAVQNAVRIASSGTSTCRICRRARSRMRAPCSATSCGRPTSSPSRSPQSTVARDAAAANAARDRGRRPRRPRHGRGSHRGTGRRHSSRRRRRSALAQEALDVDPLSGRR